MKTKRFVLLALALVALSVYLFVAAPPPLPDDQSAPGRQIAVETVLSTVAAENDVARALYTNDIVGQGSAVGLKFNERWHDDDVEAGPLPALFLRAASQNLQQSGVPLGLFLGSDYPITPSNLFQGKQAEAFKQVKATRQPSFFYADDTRQYTAMFADLVSVQACANCHNQNEHSPKRDWKLNDVMGATTWTYPKKSVGLDEYLSIVGATRNAFRAAYTAYLAKLKTFRKPPEVGDKWPRDGFFVPSADAFIGEFEKRASSATFRRVLASAIPLRAAVPGASQIEKLR